MEKPEVTYPCRWPYRVIGTDENGLHAGIAAVLNSYAYEISKGNVSKKGTYRSVHVEVNVAHEQEKNELFDKLKAIRGVKFVL